MIFLTAEVYAVTVMTSAPSYREANRNRLREALVAAARDLAVARGWENVRMVDVAAAAGVSRQTVYNEFDGRPGLAEALAVREVQNFAVEIRTHLFAHGGDVRAAGYAAILHALQEAAANPLVRAILTSPHGTADELLPYLTTRSDAVLAAAGEVVRDWAATFLPDLDDTLVAVAAESIIRLTVSHIVLPLAPPPQTASVLAEILVRLLR
jgi:AcrR family transcriptional regulator